MAEVEELVGAPGRGPRLPRDRRGRARDVPRLVRGRLRAAPHGSADPPSQRPKLAPLRDPDGRTLVTLEFDATKPGHPLLEIHYPDPLF